MTGRDMFPEATATSGHRAKLPSMSPAASGFYTPVIVSAAAVAMLLSTSTLIPDRWATDPRKNTLTAPGLFPYRRRRITMREARRLAMGMLATAEAAYEAYAVEQSERDRHWGDAF